MAYVRYKLCARDYQKVICEVLQDCEGVHNILDDVIVHAATEEEHDQRFENVVRVLSSKGLMLNRDKCQFMGHVLSCAVSTRNWSCRC